jgi:hypothetical protein
MLDVVPADPLSSRSWIGEEAVEHNGRLFVSSLDLRHLHCICSYNVGTADLCAIHRSLCVNNDIMRHS